MEAQNANIRMMELLMSWDPLGFGEGAYETESVDIIQAAHLIDEPKQLGKKIQEIFEFTSEELIPIKECERIANLLLLIKNKASCEI